MMTPNTSDAVLSRYALETVPEPPNSGVWADHLRWCVVVMDHNDAQLHVAASLLSYVLLHRHITDRQQGLAHRIITRVRALHDQGGLDCQAKLRVAGDLYQTWMRA